MLTSLYKLNLSTAHAHIVITKGVTYWPELRTRFNDLKKLSGENLVLWDFYVKYLWSHDIVLLPYLLSPLYNI